MKKYLLTSLLVTSLCTLSITAAHAAPNWLLIPKDDGHTTSWLDTNSIEPDSEHANWKNVDLMIELREAPSAKGQEASAILVATIDCTQKTLRVNERRIYDQLHAQGILLNTVPGRDSFEKFDDDIGNAFLLLIVCQ